MEYINKLYSGRLNRRTHFTADLGVTIIYWILLKIVYMLGANMLTGFLSLALVIVYLVILLSISVKRFHDLDKTGWLVLLYLIPVVGIIVWLYALLAPGTKGSNKFGESPKDAFEFDKILPKK